MAGLKAACEACGMERKAWQGENGRGYHLEGEVFCCQGCGEGFGCTCDEMGDNFELVFRKRAIDMFESEGEGMH